jgi:membrane protease YdiL (CAAX protease family)
VVESSPARPRQRLGALGEALLAFATVHVTYRALMTFTAYGHWEAAQGLSFIPGLVMSAATLGIVCALGRCMESYGLSFRQLRVDQKIGLLWTLIGITVPAGFGEELLFRGYVQSASTRPAAGRGTSSACSSAPNCSPRLSCPVTCTRSTRQTTCGRTSGM